MAAAFCQREYGTADDMQAKQQCSHATATRTVQVRTAAFDAHVLLGHSGHCDRQLVCTGNKHVHTHINELLFVCQGVFNFLYVLYGKKNQEKYAFAIQLTKGSWQAALNQIAGVCNPVNICWYSCGQCFTQKLIHAFQEAK